MAAPVVQNLEQIIADLEPAYGQTRNLYNQQRSGLGAKYDAQRSAVEGKRVQGFQDIARGANSRGLDFWGTPIEEQNQYLATQYLPGLQQATNQQNEEDMKLQQAIAQINSEQRLKGLDIRSGQQSAYQAWQQEQEKRAWEAEQARIEREAKAREAAIERSWKSSQNVDPMAEFDTYIANQFKNSGGAGNRNIKRKTQDQWVENWLNQKGVTTSNRQAYWDQINTNYNRAANWWEDWRR